MKTIRYRFIKNRETGFFEIQEKILFVFWDTIGYKFLRGTVPYRNLRKKKLIDEVLHKHYKRCKKYVNLIEYPTIYKN